jgi:hypothetical protein
MTRKRKAKACKPGRPTKYRGKFVRKMTAAAQLGATDEQIAYMLGVSLNTVTNWKNKHPEFLGALKLGKDEADDRVEHSLYQRATGYSHPDTHISVHAGKVKKTAITKHYPPETTAGIFWLKNRRPKQWRERHELTGSDGAPLIPETVNDLEVARRVAFLLAKGIAAHEKPTG